MIKNTLPKVLFVITVTAFPLYLISSLATLPYMYASSSLNHPKVKYEDSHHTPCQKMSL